MKYGEQFERESVPQWSLHNIDYNALKHHIKVHTTKDQATAAIAIPGRGSDALNKFEDDFYAELCRQHDRVQLFVSSKADEIARRLQYLSSQIHRLILRCATSSSPADRMPLKRRQRFARYERMVLQCGHDINLLHRFVSAQVVAFRKILKKYRKWTGSSALGARFRDNVLSNPKSFTKRDFSQLQAQHDDLLQTLRSALPANLPVGGQGVVMVDEDGHDRYSRTPRSSGRLSRAVGTPQPQPQQQQQQQQVGGYWNEYDYGSEAGDLERGMDDYAIYIDPNADDGFPGVKTLGAIFVNPVRALGRLIKGTSSPCPNDNTNNHSDEHTGLLSANNGEGPNSPHSTPYGTTTTTTLNPSLHANTTALQSTTEQNNNPSPRPGSTSGSGGSSHPGTPTALGTDTDLSDSDSITRAGDGDGDAGFDSDDQHTSETLTFLHPNYSTSSYYPGSSPGPSSYPYPTGYPTTSTAAVFADHHHHHHHHHPMALFQDRVLHWGSWISFFLASVLSAIATVLITAGKHKKRVEVDAGVVLGIVTALGLACAAVCMTGARERVRVWERVAAAAAFAGVCVWDGVLLVLVMGNVAV